MTCAEQQQDELEALKSIYDGDDCFHALDDTTFQYKMGEDQSAKSMVLEIKWLDDYPDVIPEINLNAFYNKHLLASVKENVLMRIKQEAEQFIGMAMTFSLFEFAKESATEWLAEQPEAVQTQEEAKPDVVQEKKRKEKKEQLSKAQKRKIADRVDVKGERPRGWDWVDVVKHLSQTGKHHEDSNDQQQQQKS